MIENMEAQISHSPVNSSSAAARRCETGGVFGEMSVATE